jgi:CRISPR type I-E-associated protein CasB/Cse2
VSNVNDFIDQLQAWGRRETGEERAVMAELRRGLQEFPHLAPYMHRHLAPFTADAGGWEKQTYYLVAALFARYHSGSKEPLYSNKPYLNMGSYFAEVVRQNQEAGDSIERRFTALLTAHPQDLHYHLRQAIAFLHGQSETTIAINWEQLFWDIRRWESDDQRPRVQEAWATSFWRRKARNSEQSNQPIEVENKENES